MTLNKAKAAVTALAPAAQEEISETVNTFSQLAHVARNEGVTLRSFMTALGYVADEYSGCLLFDYPDAGWRRGDFEGWDR